jgi:hypothetical protein
VEDIRSGEAEDGGVEDTTSRSTSTETERDEEDTSTEAPEWRRREAESGEPRAETGDGVDERRDGGRSRSGEERLSGCAAR